MFLLILDYFLQFISNLKNLLNYLVGFELFKTFFLIKLIRSHIRLYKFAF